MECLTLSSPWSKESVTCSWWSVDIQNFIHPSKNWQSLNWNIDPRRADFQIGLKLNQFHSWLIILKYILTFRLHWCRTLLVVYLAWHLGQHYFKGGVATYWMGPHHSHIKLPGDEGGLGNLHWGLPIHYKLIIIKCHLYWVSTVHHVPSKILVIKRQTFCGEFPPKEWFIQLRPEHVKHLFLPWQDKFLLFSTKSSMVWLL